MQFENYKDKPAPCLTKEPRLGGYGGITINSSAPWKSPFPSPNPQLILTVTTAKEMRPSRTAWLTFSFA